MELAALLENKYVLTIGSAVIGGVTTRLLGQLRNRVQVLEYTVRHDQVGISTEDPVLGSVKVTWQGNPLANLHNSRVSITNTTSQDLSQIVIKIFTGTTRLLTQHTSVKDSTYIPVFTEEYRNFLAVPPGAQPSQEQYDRYATSREYKIEVFNRGQTAEFRYLTHEPNPVNTPAVWLEIQRAGLKAAFKPLVPEVHGVPLKFAISIGLAATFVVLALFMWLNLPTVVAAPIAWCMGLVATSIGAWLYRINRAFVRFIAS
ncbi:MAG: hypothetical protein ACXWKJ_06815 [Telluria sp.]